MSHNRSILVFTLIVFIAFAFEKNRVTASSAESDPHSTENSSIIDEQLQEIQILRKELHDASEVDKAPELSEGVIEQPDLKTNKKTDDAFRELLLSAAQQNISEPHLEQLDNPTTETAVADAAPNVVEAIEFEVSNTPDLDIRKLQRLELSKRRTRETLILKSITEDFSFDLGEDVQQWAHILHKGKEYFIGKRDTDLVIVSKEVAKYTHSKVLTIGAPIAYLATYSFWNLQQAQQEGIILVATSDKVLWYRGNETTGHIELYWQWVVGSSISGLTHFTVNSKHYLAISAHESSRVGYYALNIYQFELQSKELWLAQRMQMAHPCSEVTFLDTGRDILLAVTQNNTAIIYTFNPHKAEQTDQLHFQLRRSFEAPGIGAAAIAAFQMGGRSYVALGGDKPQILCYQQGDFVPRTTLGANFGRVDLYFPIPVRSYRDDLLLLVQHRVDFEPHQLTVLETLVWNGEAFETSIPAPCQLGAHEMYGVSCMLDVQREAGLKGAALLRRGDEISVIVPRYKAESGLFRLHTELLAKNSELLDLQKLFTFLKDWVKEQDELVARAQHLLSMSDAALANSIEPDFTALQQLKTPELFFNGDVAEIFVNDYKWTAEDSSMQLKAVLQTIEELGMDLNYAQRHRRDADINMSTAELNIDRLEVEQVDVEELLVTQVNSENFYVQDGQLNFEGILNLHSLEVLDAVHLRERRQTYETQLALDGDLEFAMINGIPWSEIHDNLLFRDQPLTFAELHVKDIIVEGQLTVEVLNGLNFPDDYLWSSGPTTSIVTATKTFNGTLSANAVDTDGLINGVNPFDAITLSDAQHWTGLPTFAQLEVTEILELNGTARGRQLRDFPSNPTLAESHIVAASCNFEQLIVHGPIYINGQFEDAKLSTLLADVVKLPAEPRAEILVPSLKNFASIAFPIDLTIENNAVSNISVTDFVTIHTAQALNISTLTGNFYFNELALSGLYDGVNISALEEQSIKIDAPQQSPGTQLNFVQTLNGCAVHILKTLNAQAIADYQTLAEDLHMPEAHFAYLAATTAHIRHDIRGNATLNGWNLTALLERGSGEDAYLSEQANIFLNRLTLEQALITDAVHGIDTAYLLSFLQQIDDMPAMILDGKIQVDHVIVTGQLHVHTLNERDFDDDIQLTAVWLNRANYLSTQLHFMEPLELRGDLTVDGVYNGEHLPTLIADMVFRTPAGVIHVQAPKSFASDVRVFGNTLVAAINGVPFGDFATKYAANNFSGTLEIMGNLMVNHLEFHGSLNGYDFASFNELLRYDAQLDAFVLRGTIHFPHPMYVEDLSVWGNLKEVHNLTQFFQHLLYKDKVCMLEGENTFTGRVSIQNGAYVSQLNGLDLLELLDNIVFIDEAETAVIQSPVSFEAPVNAADVIVKDELRAFELTGCPLKQWLNDTLRIDRPEIVKHTLHFAPGSLDDNSFYANYLNTLDLSQLITLHTAQNFTAPINFSAIYLDGEIHVAGPVNDIDLQAAYANTLLKNAGDQHVTTPLTMQSIFVLKDLHTTAPVNSDKDLRRLATLHGDLVFESPLFFQQVTTPHVQTQDQISGINMTQWFNETLWLDERPQQWITGNWSVRTLRVNEAPTLHTYMVNVVPGESQARVMRAYDGVDEDYVAVCAELKRFRELLAQRAYFLTHLEQRFTHALTDVLPTGAGGYRQVFALQHNAKNYLLINDGCQSWIYVWNNTRQRYENPRTFATGAIDELFVIPNKNMSIELQFLTQHEHTKPLVENCTTAERAESASTERPLPKLYALQAHMLVQLPLSVANQSQSANSQLYMLQETQASVLKHAANATNARRRRQDQRVVQHFNDTLAAHASILLPNATTLREYTFSDFKYVFEHLLSELVARLQVEIDITQLSIPEADLYDEHLIQDFVSIMLELQLQKIYPADVFAQLNFDNLEIPGTPAQVLATRTVHIVWPVIVEIRELDSYLSERMTQQHPVSACILSSLGLLVRDVLLLANIHQPNLTTEQNNNNEELNAVIERIRLFQAYIVDFKTRMDAELKLELQQEATLANNTEAVTEINLQTDFPHAPRLPMPLLGAGEVLSLQVGPTTAPQTLVAVSAATKAHLVGVDAPHSIKLYRQSELDLAGAGILFQSLAAHQPRSLTTLRIRNETLLAYVERCCTVRVLIYRGVEGFVAFTKFKTAEAVNKLFALSLPAVSGENRHYLATAHAEQVVFFEVVIAGAPHAAAATNWSVCN